MNNINQPEICLVCGEGTLQRVPDVYQKLPTGETKTFRWLVCNVCQDYSDADFYPKYKAYRNHLEQEYQKALKQGLFPGLRP